MVKKLLVILTLSICSSTIAAIDTATGILHPSFHTLQLRVDGSDQAVPVIELGSEQTITFNFDEISDDLRYMRYRLLHCNALWQPDQLVESEYLDGFNEAQVNDYQFSQATTIHYINYSITIPNADMRPLISGNYLLQVYDEEQPDSTLLQARFSVVDPTASVHGIVTSRTDLDYNLAHQQLALSVDLKSTNVFNPFKDIMVVVTQNGRADNVAIAAQPSRISGSVLHYEHNPKLIFPAGNEYRRMEIVSTNYPGMRVEGYTYAHPYYHATLHTDFPRTTDSYSYDRTQHGRFRIREFNSGHPDTEADYIMTHFSLEMPRLRNHLLYLDGDFAYRRLNSDAAMTYNPETSCYEKTLLLKQGAYNYQYLATPITGNRTPALTSVVEGDKYQTTNEYLVFVYYHRPGERYDRLIGYTLIYSGT